MPPFDDGSGASLEAFALDVDVDVADVATGGAKVVLILVVTSQRPYPRH